MAYGICGIRKDGAVHEGISGFSREREPVVCTLRTLGGLREVRADENVYIVENPAVFSELMRRNPRASLVCTNGQPRLASLVLLDFLKQGSVLWYAGDFDPEGLLIAQNLKRRYGAALRLWDYRIDLYRKAMSDVTLGKSRIHSLEGVTEPELLEIAEQIRRTGKAAYQEGMLAWAYKV